MGLFPPGLDEPGRHFRIRSLGRGTRHSISFLVARLTGDAERSAEVFRPFSHLAQLRVLLTSSTPRPLSLACRTSSFPVFGSTVTAVASVWRASVRRGFTDHCEQVSGNLVRTGIDEAVEADPGAKPGPCAMCVIRFRI
jgi:hypothetical protein